LGRALSPDAANKEEKRTFLPLARAGRNPRKPPKPPCLCLGARGCLPCKGQRSLRMGVLESASEPPPLARKVDFPPWPAVAARHAVEPLINRK
jgi:hypothetical protein